MQQYQWKKSAGEGKALKTVLLFILLLLFWAEPVKAAGSADVLVDKEHFPDPMLLSYAMSLDSNHDGKLDDTELSHIMKIVMQDKKVKSLAGIEHFYMLKELDCSNNQLCCLDISGNLNITSLNCEGNVRTVEDAASWDAAAEPGFDISRVSDLGNAQLEGTVIKILDRKQPVTYTYDIGQGFTAVFSLNFVETGIPIDADHFPDPVFREYVKRFDLSGGGKLSNGELENVHIISVAQSGIEDLTGLEYFTSLKELYAEGNRLKTLDFSTLADLETADVRNNRLCFLDISACGHLSNIQCSGNVRYLGALTAYDMSAEPGFDISKASEIENAKVDGTRITIEDRTRPVTYTYDLGLGESETFTLYFLEGEEEGIPIDEEHFPDPVFREYVRRFDQSGGGKLSDGELSQATVIEVRNRGIGTLEGIGYFTSLITLDCSLNSLNKLDLYPCSKLVSLTCGSNPLLEVVLSGCESLETLDISGAKLETLDVGNCPLLKKLDCSRNKIVQLILGEPAGLQELYCGHNALTDLDLSNCPGLTVLSCYNTRIEALDLSGCTNIRNVDCRNNRLCSLFVEEHEALAYLNASGNSRTFQEASCDLSTLEGFELPRASGWVNAVRIGSVVRQERKGEPVTYQYDMGNGRMETFTLVFPDTQGEPETQQPVHTHTPGEWEVVKQPKAGEEGLRIRSCTGCGEILMEESIPALEPEPEQEEEQSRCFPHQPGEVKLVKEATAAEQGLTEVRCILCGKLLETRLLPRYTVKWNEKSASLQKKQSTKVLKAACMEGDQIKSYRSSNQKVVKVSSTGTLTAVKTGTAKITVTTAKGASAAITIKVQKGPVLTKKITSDQKSVTLKVKEKKKVSVSLKPLTANQKITWKSGDKKIASVDKKGKITGKKKGKTTITVKSGNKKTKIKVTVK